MKNALRFMACLLVSIALFGCGAADKQAMLKKARHAKTKAELETALGKPDNFKSADVPGLGSAESWEYKASDGKVTFQIIGDKVVLKAAE